MIRLHRCPSTAAMVPHILLDTELAATAAPALQRVMANEGLRPPRV